MAEELTPVVGTSHGHSESSEEWRRIEQAYREIQRRDDQAEARTWRAQKTNMVFCGVIVLLVGVLVWAFVSYRQVQAFVQVVQVDEQNRVVQLGIPQGLLAYEPADSIWMDMLGEWVRRIRWREEDKTHTKSQWAWVYRHTCAQARRVVQVYEHQEQPFRPSKRLVTVELKSVTKRPVPFSFDVQWIEHTTEPSAPEVKHVPWTGTFSVGRLQLPTLTDAMDNRLGLCVTAYDWSPQAGGK
jgi:type IV secretory pathway TrbF-like protein